MDSEAYWAKRSEEREAAWQLKSRETLEKELAAYYEASLDHIQRNIDALYGRFAKDNALPMEEARKLLTGKEYRTWRMSLEEYVAQIDAGDKMLERELNTLAMRSRISRLDKLYSETLMELDGLGRKMRDRMDGFLGDAYKDNLYRGLYEIGHVGKALPAISQVDSKSVEAVLRTPWSGKNYSTRIWKNQKQLARVIQDEVVASVHRGDDVRKISRRVADKMGVGLSNAQRLVRTELNYVHNQAALDSIRDAEIDYFRFVATLDSRTSTMCREHDGKIYPIDDADTGENIPPLHPRCRSIIVGSLGGGELKGQTRIAKGDEGKYIHVPAEMTYEDFQAVYVEKTQTVDEWKEARAPKPKSKSVEVPVFEFTPAKSIEEAEVFAKRTFIGDGYSPAFKNVAVYKGISLDVANEINRTIAEIFDKFDIPKLNGIKAISPTSAQGKKAFKDGADAVAAYNPVEKGIFLNKNVLKDVKAFAKHQKEAQKAWDLVMKNIDKLQGLQRELALLYKNAGRSLVDNSLAGAIRHEVGHHVQWNVLDAKTNNAIGAKMKQYAPKISGYANAAKGEYLAESFTAYMKGEMHLVDPEYIAAMKAKLLKKELACSAKDGIINIEKKSFEELAAYKGKLDNATVRKWYVYHDKHIHEEIDKNQSVEDMARQAFDLRNKYRTEARELMADQETRKELDEKRPNSDWESKIAEKMRSKSISREEAIVDIYNTAIKSNQEINKQFGLGDDEDA